MKARSFEEMFVEFSIYYSKNPSLLVLLWKTQQLVQTEDEGPVAPNGSCLLPNALVQIQHVSANSQSPARCERRAQTDTHTQCVCTLAHCCSAFHNHETIKTVSYITSCAIFLFLTSDSWQGDSFIPAKKMAAIFFF